VSQSELAATVLACGLLVVSLATHAVAWTTRAGRLARNHTFGIRTPSTQASDEAWHAAHRAALPWLTWAHRVGYTGAVLALILASAFAVLAGSINIAALLTVVIGAYLVVLACITVGSVVATRKARSVGVREQGSQGELPGDTS